MERLESSFNLPPCNETMELRPLAERQHRVGDQLGGSFKIVWVNDGSMEATERVLIELAAHDARIR